MLQSCTDGHHRTQNPARLASRVRGQVRQVLTMRACMLRNTIPLVNIHLRVPAKTSTVLDQLPTHSTGTECCGDLLAQCSVLSWGAGYPQDMLVLAFSFLFGRFFSVLACFGGTFAGADMPCSGISRSVMSCSVSKECSVSPELDRLGLCSVSSTNRLTSSSPISWSKSNSKSEAISGTLIAG